ncbi:hypothetical protein ACJ41O_007144 [Fusarium nematophilum]
MANKEPDQPASSSSEPEANAQKLTTILSVGGKGRRNGFTNICSVGRRNSFTKPVSSTPLPPSEPDHQPAASGSSEPKPEANAQKDSPLLSVLPEVRHRIYVRVFSSTRFTHGRRATEEFYMGISYTHVSPAPNGLALLRTCRRLRYDIGDSWLGHVLFNFEDPCVMLDKLTPLSRESLGKIRHLRVRGESLNLLYHCNTRPDVYPLVSAFKLLPGLHLDRLTVLSRLDATLRYETLDRLVREGQGWRELHYFSHHSDLVGFPCERGDPIQRRAQPEDWQGAIEARDGIYSSPSVTVYRSTKPGAGGFILDPRMRERIEQRACDEREAEGFRVDAAIMDPRHRRKEMMVLVKRGEGVDYAVRPDALSTEKPDIRTGFPGMTWKEIRDVCKEVEDDGTFSFEWIWDIVVDEYDSVDDGLWTVPHLEYQGCDVTADVIVARAPPPEKPWRGGG